MVRDVDRRRIAAELFELAGRSSVSKDHIETLVKRYREGLAGAQKVLLAQRVGEEVLSWQDEMADAQPLVEIPAPSANPGEREPLRPARSQPPLKSSEPEAERGRRRDRVLPAERARATVKEWAPTEGSERGLERGRERDLEPDRHPERHPDPELIRAFDLASEPPPRARGREEVRGARGGRSAPPPADKARPPLSRPPVRGSSPPPKRSAHPPRALEPDDLDSFDAIPPPPPLSWKPPGRLDDLPDDLDGGWGDPEQEEGRAPKRRRDHEPPSRDQDRLRDSERPRDSDRPRPRSHRPAAESERPRAQLSERPAARAESRAPKAFSQSDFSLDDEPRRFAPGRSRPPPELSRKGSALPDIETDDRGVDPERRRRGDDLTDSVAPPPPPLAPAAYPLGDSVGTAQGEYVSRKTLIGAAGAIFIVLLLTAFIARPAFLFGDPARPVTGLYVSKHLGASIKFPVGWMAAEDLQDEEKKGNWTRRVAMFFKGGTDYHTAGAQLVVIIFDSDKAIAGDDDARQVGANETLNMVSRRRCDAFEYEGKKGTQCVALQGRPGRAFGVVETYYAEAGKIIFTRAMFEMPMPMGGDPMQAAEAAQTFERDVFAMFVELESTIFSLKILSAK